MGRLKGQWRQRLDSGARAELSGTASRRRARSDDFERVAVDGDVQTRRTLTPSAINWELRLGLKL